MTVPSQYKGFSKLPEEVQRKMSPELAEKYNMGGDVLQRPLFRQMGGPADAMPANQAMPPAPMPMAQGPDPMLQQAEAQMQGVGEQFAQQTMANIDQAEDIEGAINALRGNAKPIEARYDELAGFVGQGDAQQTPESVLAMVQPTIMMTEQGAMDSGIGQLIQSIAGSDMETPTGEPTAMGQGVGELMAMGAGNTPPVNFNQGGPVEVRRFKQGTPPTGNTSAESFLTYLDPISQALETRQSRILGTPEERARELEEAKRFQRGQAGLDLAKFGLALASPTDQPMSFAEKLAAAGQPLATSLGERAQALQDIKRAQTAEERALAMQNLQTAAGLSTKLFESDVAQSALEKKLEAEQENIKLQAGLDFQNKVLFQEIKTADEIMKMGVQKNITQEINKTLNGYTVANKEIDLAHQQVLKALDQAFESDQTDKKAATQKNLLELKQEFTGNENEKRRVFEEAQNIANRLLKEKDLSLQEIKQKAEIYNDEQKLLLAQTKQEFEQQIGSEQLELAKREFELKEKESDRDRFETIVEEGNIFIRDKDNPEAELKTLIEAVEEYEPDYMDFTDNQTNQTTLIDMNSEAGKAALAKQTADPTRYAITKTPTTRQVKAQSFIIQSGGRSKAVTSFDGGRTYVNKEGEIVSLTGLNATPLSDETGYKIIQVENKKNIAGDSLIEFTQKVYGLAKTGTADNPKALSKEDTVAMRNAFEEARNGTGFYANLFALADAVTGLIPIKQLRGLFKDTQSARQYLRALTVLGRSALVINPKFPVAELEKVGQLFANPDAFFRNPESEAEKLIILKETAEQQYIRNLKELSGSLSEDIRSQVESNNFEIDRLLHLLEGVPSGLQINTQSSTENDGNTEALGKYIQSTRKD